MANTQVFDRKAMRSSRQCEGKTAYSSRKKALVGVRFLREHGEKVHPYPCLSCKNWHLGH